MPAGNFWSDISSIAQTIQDDAIFVVREAGQMQGLITVFRDASGMNPRVGYKYNQGTAAAVGEDDDLTSRAFTPSADQTLTPAEIGLQFFVTDSRADSEAPESIVTDAAQELGFAALDKVETDLLGDMASLTGGTIGTAGSAITWGYVSAAIAQARNANKNIFVPLSCVIHGYQAAVLAKSASIAGATTIAATGVADQVTRQGLSQAFMFMGVPIYQVFGAVDTGIDFTGGVFPRLSLAIDWRRSIRVEAERDASRRGTEFNMSAVYAHGVWRPARGVKMIFDAAAPTS
jgi:hypothetical protein